MTKITLIFICVNIVSSQLVINVKNKGGDLIQETLTGEPDKNTISLEFQKLDGTYLKMRIDFKSVRLLAGILYLIVC